MPRPLTDEGDEEEKEKVAPGEEDGDEDTRQEDEEGHPEQHCQSQRPQHTLRHWLLVLIRWVPPVLDAVVIGIVLWS